MYPSRRERASTFITFMFSKAVGEQVLFVSGQAPLMLVEPFESICQTTPRMLHNRNLLCHVCECMANECPLLFALWNILQTYQLHELVFGFSYNSTLVMANNVVIAHHHYFRVSECTDKTKFVRWLLLPLKWERASKN